MKTRAFTLVELLTVVAIIGVLASLVLMTTSYIQNKAARARAETEIQAIASACEKYKGDNGVYPRNGDTDALNPRKALDPNTYLKASLYLYQQLSNDTDLDGTVSTAEKNNAPNPAGYMQFSANQTKRATPGAPPSAGNKVQGLSDPYGYSYGYSTIYQSLLEKGDVAPGNIQGYNTDYDLWSTGGSTRPRSGESIDTYQSRWIKNW